jgi:hypothetical protein
MHSYSATPLHDQECEVCDILEAFDSMAQPTTLGIVRLFALSRDVCITLVVLRLIMLSLAEYKADKQ